MPVVIFQYPSTPGPADLARAFGVSADAFNLAGSIGHTLEGEDLFTDLKDGGDIGIMLRQITATVTCEFHVAVLEVTGEPALGIRRLVQAENNKGVFDVFGEIFI